MEQAIPESGMDLWSMFWEIKTQESISWTDIYSYCVFYDMMLEPYEVQIIMAMNGAYNKFIQEKELPDKTKPTNNVKGK